MSHSLERPNVHTQPTTMQTAAAHPLKRQRSDESVEDVPRKGKMATSRMAPGKTCHFIQLSNAENTIPPTVKRAIQEALDRNGRTEITLQEDRLSRSRAGKVLKSQQSKIRGLQIFTTSDGSLWLDHFYDEIATGVLQDKRVQEALSQDVGGG